MLHDLLAILSGALFCNSVPHLVAGLQGRRFPTPFARPLGRGLSPAWANFAWGFCNLAAAVVTTVRWPPPQHGSAIFDLILVFGGVAVAGAFLSVRFGRIGAGSLG